MKQIIKVKVPVTSLEYMLNFNYNKLSTQLLPIINHEECLEHLDEYEISNKVNSIMFKVSNILDVFQLKSEMVRVAIVLGYGKDSVTIVYLRPFYGPAGYDKCIKISLCRDTVDIKYGIFFHACHESIYNFSINHSDNPAIRSIYIDVMEHQIKEKEKLKKDQSLSFKVKHNFWA